MDTSRPSHRPERERAAVLVGSLWRASPPLTGVGLLMAAAAAGFAVAMALDPRVVVGAPAWLKPFKFAVSTGIYSLTLAWVFGWLVDRPRTRRVVGWTTATVFVLEVAIIAVQAGRGTTSHFNAATPLDATLLSVMGLAILVQTLASVAVVVALLRQRFADRALGWALRLGMLLTLAGALTGPLMTRPTAEQLAVARAGGPMPVVGAHSVGGRDGGPGVPVTGWSREHGDVRVPHFVGLHGIQVLAVVALLAARARQRDETRLRLVVAAAASHAALFALLLVQALRGESVAAPGAETLALLAGWALATALAIGWVAMPARTAHAPLDRSAA